MVKNVFKTTKKSKNSFKLIQKSIFKKILYLFFNFLFFIYYFCSYFLTPFELIVTQVTLSLDFFVTNYHKEDDTKLVI
jgi:hypothetical protein